MKLGTEVGPISPACHSCLIPFPPHPRLCEVQFVFSTQDRQQSGVSLSSSQSPNPPPSNNNQLQLTLVLGGQASQPPKTTLNRKEKLNNKIRSQNQKKKRKGRAVAEAEVPTFWLPDVKNWLIGKDPDAGKY